MGVTPEVVQLAWPAHVRLQAFDHSAAQLTGWQRESIDTIDAFHGVDSLATFPTLSALTDVCVPTFEFEELRRGRYELAESCPTIRFNPRIADQGGENAPHKLERKPGQGIQCGRKFHLEHCDTGR